MTETSTDAVIRDVPNIRADEIKRALKGMEMGKHQETSLLIKNT